MIQFAESSPSLKTKLFSTTTEFQKSIQVSVFGAETGLGRATSFLLKQNPLVSVLRLHGESNIHNMIADLQQMDTSCKVQGFEGMSEVSKALRVGRILNYFCRNSEFNPQLCFSSLNYWVYQHPNSTS